MNQRDEDGNNERAATRALAREVGSRSVEMLQAGLTRVLTDMTATTRWILAALLALNGGAVLLLANRHDGLDPAALKLAMVLFVLGAVVAVLAALLGALAALAMSRALGEAISAWTQVATSGEISEEALNSAQRLRRRSAMWLLPAFLIGLASLTLFLLGATSIAQAYGVGALVPSATSAAPVAMLGAVHGAHTVAGGNAMAGNAADPALGSNGAQPAIAAAKPEVAQVAAKAVAHPAEPASKAKAQPKPAPKSTPKSMVTVRPKPAPKPTPRPTARPEARPKPEAKPVPRLTVEPMPPIRSVSPLPLPAMSTTSAPITVPQTAPARPADESPKP